MNNNPSDDRPLIWRIKRWWWASWQIFRISMNKPVTMVAPKPNLKPINLIPMRQRYPRIPIDIPVYEEMPPDERKLSTGIFISLQLWLNRLFPQMHRGLPEIDPNIEKAMLDARLPKYGQAFRRPILPPIYHGEGKPDLEDLAMQSPYSIFLERDGSGDLQWDFRELGQFEHQDGLCSLGVRVGFQENPETKRLEAAEISGEEYGTVKRGDKDWDRVKAVAVCAATTHMALTRHFNFVHLVSGNHWDVVTRNQLPSDHPLYRLLWPSLCNSLYTNDGITRVQLNPDGDFVNMFSFSHDGLTEYFNAMNRRYEIELIDPDADWRRRGLEGARFDCPTQENLEEVFKLMYDHANRYITHYYGTEEALQEDPEVRKWVGALDEIIPNGLGGFIDGGYTRDRLARLIGGYIYEGNTIHDMAGTSLWDYQLWVDRNPLRIYRDGRRISLDVFQRAINNNFALQVKRAPLLANYKAVALDEKGAGLFTRFHEECQDLQRQYDENPTGPWRMEPKNLEIGMNA